MRKGKFATFFRGLVLAAVMGVVLGLSVQALISLPADYARWPIITFMFLSFVGGCLAVIYSISRLDENVGMFAGVIPLFLFIFVSGAIGPAGDRAIPDLGDAVYEATGYDPTNDIFAVAYVPNWIAVFQGDFSVLGGSGGLATQLGQDIPDVEPAGPVRSSSRLVDLDTVSTGRAYRPSHSEQRSFEAFLK